MRMIPRALCPRPGALTCHTFSSSSSLSLNLLFRADYETRESVYYEISNSARGLKSGWHGNSFVACLPSDSPNISGGRNRVSKDERKAMLESFVNRYRETNAGKFPTPSLARKHVGGSYYIIRQILQELESNAICSPVEKPNDCSIGKELNSQSEPQFEVKQIRGPETEINDSQTIIVNHVEAGDANAVTNIKNDSQTIVVNDVEADNVNSEQDMQNDSPSIAGNHVEVDDTNSEHLEGREGTQSSPWTIETMLKAFMKLSSADRESQTVGISCPSVEKEEVAYEDSGHEGKQGSQVVTESDDYTGEISEKHRQEEQLLKRSMLWGNLKSFADGIISNWKRN